MAFRVVRLRREARRNAKLDEIFTDRDKDQTGYISMDSVKEVFRIYEVEFDEVATRKYFTDSDEIAKTDFMQLATDKKLLDFDMNDKSIIPSLKTRKAPTTPVKGSAPRGQKPGGGGGGLLCCCSGDVSPEPNTPVDKIEAAFRKLDVDGDGFLSWDEFQALAVKMEPDQAERIFMACDKDQTGFIGLEAFRSIADLKKYSSRGQTEARDEDMEGNPNHEDDLDQDDLTEQNGEINGNIEAEKEKGILYRDVDDC